ncbi:MAG: hypothetical protein N4A74_20600 [Carboxylicivirga sp.]|nr:hypothetical protein [Carboxylicivirga sp.]
MTQYLKYCKKDTTDYIEFIAYLIRCKEAIIKRPLNTSDGTIDVVLKYSDYWEEYHVLIDGVLYDIHPYNYEYILDCMNGNF